MALDARYFLAYTFQKYFVDKDTGAPLEGTASFFRDSARLVPKNVFKLSGTPPAYTYVSLGPTVNIANGVPTDEDGNDIAVYFLPYTIDINNNITTTVDLYYYSVSNSLGDLQFTREAQPNVFQGSGTSTVTENFVPNGQFLLHNDLPATDIVPLYDAGEIRANVTEIAQGGWTFEVADFTQSKDFVTFEQHLPTTPDIDANPRYSAEITCDDAGNLQTKNLALRFDDVNKFGSPLLAQRSTYGFTAKSLSGNALNGVQLKLYKFYGTNGSAFSSTPITTFNIPTSETKFAFAIPFGNNSAKTIGIANDDFLQLQIILPGELLDVEFTDFYLAPNDVSTALPDFGQTTNSQFIYRSLVPPVPDYAGFNLYLTERITKAGKVYDTSEISKGEFFSSYDPDDWDTDNVHKETNLVLPWGNQFETTSYSPLGIPWLRLQQKYWIASLNISRYGTGLDFMTATIPNADNNMLVSNNSEGAVTSATDGATATGFTFVTIHKETAPYFCVAYMDPDVATFIMEGEFIGPVSAQPTIGTATFSFASVQIGTSLLRNIVRVVAPAGSTLTNTGNPGKYFTFDTIDGSAANHSFYVWFFATNETDPAPGGTGIKIQITATGSESAQLIAQKVQQALNGWQETTIATVAAASITGGGGSYFNIYSHVNPSSEQKYVVWYKIISVGTQPVVADAIFIEVDLPLGTETAAQVATATQKAMNMKYFAVPDYRGQFPRIWNAELDPPVDQDATLRHSLVPGVMGDLVGTFQPTGNLSHHHGTLGIPDNVQNGTGASFSNAAGTFTDYDGGYESRPPNIYVNCAIRY